MTRRVACSDRAVVKCAHSASTSAIFDFTGKEMPLEVCH